MSFESHTGISVSKILKGLAGSFPPERICTSGNPCLILSELLVGSAVLCLLPPGSGWEAEKDIAGGWVIEVDRVEVGISYFPGHEIQASLAFLTASWCTRHILAQAEWAPLQLLHFGFSWLSGIGHSSFMLPSTSSTDSLLSAKASSVPIAPKALCYNCFS